MTACGNGCEFVIDRAGAGHDAASASVGPSMVVRDMSHPRRQQFRCLIRGCGYAGGAVGLLLLAGAAAEQGAGFAAIAMVVIAGGLIWAARRSLQLAGRSRVGAHSERVVRLALMQLRRRGWWVRHGVGWPGGGDVDHLVRAPGSLGFAIETKTRNFSQAHLERTVATARWAARRRRSYYRRGVVPVLCVVRARGLEQFHDEVLVVSLDRLPAALRGLADRNARPRSRAPMHLAPETSTRAPVPHDRSSSRV
jgi:hypothetical protein